MEQRRNTTKVIDSQLYIKAYGEVRGSCSQMLIIISWFSNLTFGIGCCDSHKCVCIVSQWITAVLYYKIVSFLLSPSFWTLEKKNHSCNKIRTFILTTLQWTKPLFFFFLFLFLLFFNHCSCTGSASWCSLRGVREWCEERKWERLHFHRVYYRWGLTASRCGNHGAAASRGWTDYCIWPNVYRTEYGCDICSG